jgi:signal transduction histidine kinase
MKMKQFIKNIKKFGFRARMRLGMTMVIIVVTGIGVAVSIYMQSRDQLKFVDRLGKNISAGLSHNSKLAILSEEPTNLAGPLKAVLDEPQVIGVEVYMTDGRLLAGKKRVKYSLDNLSVASQLEQFASSSEEQIMIESRTESGRQLRSYLAKVMINKSSGDIFNIESGEEVFSGFVRVDMLLDELAVNKATIIYNNCLMVPIYIVIGMFFSGLIEQRISKPLMELKKAVGAMAKGDFSMQMELQSNDELGMLGESFNQMSKQLSLTIEELNYANETLEKTNKELEEFTYIVSHDLQEPLRKVHSFGQFLMEDYNEQLPDEGKDYVERMQKASVKMKQLIQDLLLLSRVGTGKAEFSSVDTGEVVQMALDDLALTIEESGAQVVVGQLPPILGNKTRLAQLFQNLIGNAVKYRSDERNPEIEISAKEQGDQVVFSVKDNGMGIEEKFFGKVFGVFQRLHGQGEKYKGTGIGLSLCNKVVQKHGGKIWVESTLGKGSTFYFTMPKARIKIGGV